VSGLFFETSSASLSWKPRKFFSATVTRRACVCSFRANALKSLSGRASGKDGSKTFQANVSKSRRPARRKMPSGSQKISADADCPLVSKLR
jgi:hypothetical protein